MLLLGTAALALFYRLAVPRSEGARVRLWPGALLATSSGVLSSWALGAYASSVGMYSLYYGSLAAVAVSQLWLFIASLALLAGAMLNAHLEVRNLNAD